MSGEKYSEVKVAIRPVTYVYGIVAVIITCVFLSWLTGFTHSGFLMDWGQVPYETAMYSTVMLMFFVPWIVSLLGAIFGRKGVRLPELLVITSMVYITWITATFYGTEAWVIYGGSGRLQAGLAWYFEELLGPTNYLYTPNIKDEAIWLGFMQGKASVPWGAWATPIAFAFMYTTVYYLAQFMMSSLFRRQWLEVEDLPFPMATGTVALLEMAESKGGKRPEIFTNKFLYAGVIVGILGIFPNWGQFLGIGIPAPLWSFVGFDMTPITVSSLPYVPMVFAFAPFIIGAMFLVPTAVLLSYVVFTFGVWWIMNPLNVATGWWDPTTPGYGYGYTWWLARAGVTGVLARWGLFWGGGWGWFGYGSIAGLVVWPMITNRRETARTLRAIFGKPDPTVEKNEPTSYRNMLFILLGIIVVWIALLSVATNGVCLADGRIGSTLIYIFAALFWEGVFASRIAGEIGQVLHNNNEHTWHHLWHHTFIWWPVANKASPWYADRADRALYVRALGMEYSYIAEGQPGYTSLEMYRAAANMGVHSKHLFKGMIVAVPVAVIVSLVTFLTFGYMYGFAAKWSHFAILGWLAFYPAQKGNHIVRDPTPIYQTWAADPVPTQWLAFIISFIVSIVMFILRAKLPWFPLHPAGPAMAWLGVTPNVLWPAIIALIAKRIVIRIGGTELYSRKGVPFAVGLVVGYSIMIIVTALYRANVALAAP